MKKEKLTTALNGIDEKYVEKASSFRKKKLALPVTKWGALAASLAIVIAGTALILPRIDPSLPPVVNETTTEKKYQNETFEQTEASTVLASSTTMAYASTTFATGEMGWREQYIARIAEGAYKNYVPMRALALYEAPMGEKLEENITVYGFWSTNDKDYFDADDYTGKENIESLRAEVYALKGVSPDVAVLVKYLDKGDALTTEHYYVFVNKDVENGIETLADFYARFYAEFYFSVQPSANILISSVDRTNGGETDSFYITSGAIAEGLRERILSLDGRTLSDAEIAAHSFTKQMTFDISLHSAGAYTGYVGVFDNGYIIFHIYSTNHFSFAFDIGTENAEMLMAYVEENAELEHSHAYKTEETVTYTSFTGETVETTTCTNDTACETYHPIATSGAYIPE
jgi:hypothetical protein